MWKKKSKILKSRENKVKNSQKGKKCQKTEKKPPKI